MASADVVKLQAQLVKLQGQFDEVLKERDAANKGECSRKRNESICVVAERYLHECATPTSHRQRAGLVARLSSASLLTRVFDVLFVCRGYQAA
jgi:hypothetical protein